MARNVPARERRKTALLAKAGTNRAAALNRAIHTESAPIAAAAALPLPTATGQTVSVTGAGVTITSVPEAPAGVITRVEFDDANTLTHNATSLILPTAANITTAAGDTAEFESLGDGNYRVRNYTRADGSSLAGSGFASTSTTSLTPRTGATETITTQSGLGFTAGVRVRVTSSSVPECWFEGVVFSYSGTTMLVNTDSIGSTVSTKTDWLIRLGGVDVGYLGNTNQQTRSFLLDCLMLRGADLPSAGTLDMLVRTGSNYSDAPSLSHHVTGTTTINFLGNLFVSNLGTAAQGPLRLLIFDDVLQLTHDASFFILPGAANITTAAGDCLLVRNEGWGGVKGIWRCVNYMRASGKPVVSGIEKLFASVYI